MNFALPGFIVYLIIILVVGFITYNRNKSHSDFFIAGRKLKGTGHHGGLDYPCAHP